MRGSPRMILPWEVQARLPFPDSGAGSGATGISDWLRSLLPSEPVPVADAQGNPVVDEAGNPITTDGSVLDSLAVGGGIVLAGALVIGVWAFTRR